MGVGCTLIQPGGIAVVIYGGLVYVLDVSLIPIPLMCEISEHQRAELYLR